MAGYQMGVRKAYTEKIVLNQPMASIGPFGLSPDVRLQIKVDRQRLTYTIEDSDSSCRLQGNGVRTEGRLSDISRLTLSDAERRHKHIPFGAVEYAFLYPLADLTAKKELDAFGPYSFLLPTVAALRTGAFVYLDKDSKVIRINALIEDDSSASGFFVFQGPFKLPESATATLEEKEMGHPVSFKSLKFYNALKFCWLRPEQLKEVDVPHGGFVYLFTNPACNCYFRLADQHTLFRSFRRPPSGAAPNQRPKSDKLPEELEQILQTAAGFAMGYPATNRNNVSYSLQNEVPYQLRLTSALLVALGRNPNDKFMIVKSGRGHYEYKPEEPEPQGLRWVSLSMPLHQLTEPIVWSSRNAEKWLREWYTDPVIEESLRAVKVGSLEDIYGPAEYPITPETLYQYEQSTQIRLGELLPPFFYRSLLQLTADPRYIQFFWETKSSPLAEFLEPVAGQGPSLQRNPVARDLMTALLQRVAASPPDFGFKGSPHVKKTLEQSLTELSTSVVISQEGQFLLGNYNQILEPGPKAVPILFLATAAIDFDEPDRHPAAEREESRYFTITERNSDGSVKGEWKSPEARQALKDRLKLMYDMLFTRCAQAGVTHPSFLPIGLGAFLPRIESSSVKSIYHEAQFELLSEKDYHFQYYFLNPGPGRKEAEELLPKYTFIPEVVLHTKNGKFLASELARAGYRTCCLNPSDYIAMMSGMMGYWWEVGKGSRYVGEEDIVATSTLVLASRGISTVYDSARIAAHIP
eukprot:EG_transcript_2211